MGCYPHDAATGAVFGKVRKRPSLIPADVSWAAGMHSAEGSGILGGLLAEKMSVL